MGTLKENHGFLFEWNAMSHTISPEVKTRLLQLYKEHELKWWCCKRKHRSIKRWNRFFVVLTASFAGAGIIGGSVTMNPVIIASMTAASGLMVAFLKTKKLDETEASLKYGKDVLFSILVDLKEALRAQNDPDMIVLNAKIQEREKFVTETCPSFQNDKREREFAKRLRAKETRRKTSFSWKRKSLRRSRESSGGSLPRTTELNNKVSFDVTG